MGLQKTDFRWKKTPSEVYQDLAALLERFRHNHSADPDEVIEDIFAEISDYMTGYVHQDVSWTEPDTPMPATRTEE